MAEQEALLSLLERCKNRDRAAFAALFAQFQLRVSRSAYLITRREDFVDDITQLVFIELYSALDRYDLGRPFVPWLYRIVYNICMDYLKRTFRDNALALPLAATYREAAMRPDPTFGPAEQVEQAEMRQAIMRAIGRLPVKQRSVLVLRYYDGLREAEIAEAVQCPVGTVKSRLHRAHQLLSKELRREQIDLPFEYDEKRIHGKLSIAGATFEREERS